ncbi:MAG: helix-turn-helix domain-containing protein [bacterium]|nr:helix-turn-helix domain-containing protein [bacterium]
MIINKLSEIIGRERIRRTELAKWSGVSLSTIHRLYYDQTKGIDFETLDRLCEALQCTPNDLFQYIPNKKA